MKAAKYFQITFLVVGTLTALEFIFVRGMFTWLIAVTAMIVVGSLNVIINIKHKEWLQASLYILSTIALCMGYFVLT
jgi:predicted membrane channel-forming protein YqfA (hemolysin III family)